MSHNICQECYDAICHERGVPEIEVYSTRAFPWSKCERCGGQARYLVPGRRYSESSTEPSEPKT